MVSKTETPNSSKLDAIKLFGASFLLLASIGAFYYFNGQPLFIRVLVLLIMSAIAIGIAYTSTIGQHAWEFIRASRGEMRKVVWPTRVETLQASAAVVFMVIVVGILLWLLDMVLFWLVQSLFTTK